MTDHSTVNTLHIHGFACVQVYWKDTFPEVELVVFEAPKYGSLGLLVSVWDRCLASDSF